MRSCLWFPSLGSRYCFYFKFGAFSISIEEHLDVADWCMIWFESGAVVKRSERILL